METDEAFHIAKLALFNVRVLWNIQEQRENESVNNIIIDSCQNFGVQLPISLMHQTTFLQVAYICLVWLWESVQLSNVNINNFEDAIDFEFCNKITKLNGPRELKCPRDFLKLLRNALSHRRVEFNDSHFFFSDIKERGRASETEPTKISITWADLGLLSEKVFFGLQRIIYPTNLRTNA